jgi:hypothetical protein
MQISQKSLALRTQSKWLGIGPTAKRLGVNHYTVMRLALIGKLEVGHTVDDKPKISVASIKRLERETAVQND